MDILTVQFVLRMLRLRREVKLEASDESRQMHSCRDRPSLPYQKSLRGPCERSLIGFIFIPGRMSERLSCWAYYFKGRVRSHITHLDFPNAVLLDNSSYLTLESGSTLPMEVLLPT
jgi:hypothetical protein